MTELLHGLDHGDGPTNPTDHGDGPTNPADLGLFSSCEGPPVWSCK